MKRLTTIILTLLLSFSLFADEKPEKIRELGFSVSSLRSDFELSYKIGNENAKWRFSGIIADASIDFNGFPSINQFNSTIGISIGKEFNKEVLQNITYLHGFDFVFRSRIYSTVPGTILSNFISINLVFGFSGIIKDHFIIGLEYRPFIKYSFFVADEDLEIGISPNITMTLAYRF